MGITTPSDEFTTTEASEDMGMNDASFERFYRPAVEVRACQLHEHVVVDTGAETALGEPGDWLIEATDGTRRICNDETFREIYRGRSVAANKALHEDAE